MARAFGRRSIIPSVLPSRTTMLLAGLTLGILFAPRNGRSTRTLIAQRYHDWMDRISVWLENLAKKTRQQSTRVQGVVYQMRERGVSDEMIVSDEILAQRVRREGDRELEPLKSFIIPGGTPKAAALHVARTVCRRAERQLSKLAEAEPVSPPALHYLNRLSDLLFVMCRAINQALGHEDVMWRPKPQ